MEYNHYTRGYINAVYISRKNSCLVGCSPWINPYRDGFLVASFYDDPEQYTFAVKRYLGSVSSSGEAIDRGIYVIVIGIALGVLTDISSSVSKRRNSEQA